MADELSLARAATLAGAQPTVLRLTRFIGELKADNVGLKAAVDELQGALASAADTIALRSAELAHCKIEQTTKHRVEERDDWRALVASVQGDRKRLEQEIDGLQAENAALRRAVSDDAPGAGPAADDAMAVATLTVEMEALKRTVEAQRCEIARLRRPGAGATPASRIIGRGGAGRPRFGFLGRMMTTVLWRAPRLSATAGATAQTV